MSSRLPYTSSQLHCTVAHQRSKHLLLLLISLEASWGIIFPNKAVIRISFRLLSYDLPRTDVLRTAALAHNTDVCNARQWRGICCYTERLVWKEVFETCLLVGFVFQLLLGK